MSNTGGFKWLEEALHIEPVQPLLVVSSFGSSRKTVESADGTRIETYPNTMRPAPTVDAHLAFALRYEPLHLEFLARLFLALDPVIVEEWVRREPTSQYARRTGFLFEWLTDTRLAVDDVAAGNYIDAIDSEKYLVATRALNSPR